MGSTVGNEHVPEWALKWTDANFLIVSNLLQLEPIHWKEKAEPPMTPVVQNQSAPEWKN